MPSRDLECEVMKGAGSEGKFSLQADPDDTAAMQAALRSWLEGHGWDAGHWPRFELHVRYAGEYKVRKRVRA